MESLVSVRAKASHRNANIQISPNEKIRMRTKIRQKKKDPKPRTIVCVGDAKHTVFDDEDAHITINVCPTSSFLFDVLFRRFHLYRLTVSQRVKIGLVEVRCSSYFGSIAFVELDSLRIRRRSWKVRNDRTIFVSGRGDHRRS